MLLHGGLCVLMCREVASQSSLRFQLFRIYLQTLTVFIATFVKTKALKQSINLT